MKKMSLRLPEDMDELVDVARGDVAKERWIRRAIQERLEREGFVSTLTQRREDLQVVEGRN